jgi:type VI secretion system Hcp family effector
VAAGAGGSVQPAAALPPSRNAPGPPCFLTVEGRTQGRFPGSRTRAGQSWIEGFAFEIGGIAPTDAATGAATGRRRWQASFRSVAGPATPRLVRAADAGELLQVTVELVEAGANGAEVVTLRARLEDATITSLRTVVDEPGDGRPSRFGAYDEVQVNIRALSIEHPATATTGQATNR